LAIGARNLVGARRAGLVACGAGTMLMAVFSAGFAMFPRALARLFTGQARVLPTAVSLIVVAAVFQISNGVQAVGAGVLRGAGVTRFTFAANLVGHYAVGLPVALGLTFWSGLGVTGLWWGLCVGFSVVAAALVLRFFSLSRKHIEPLAITSSSRS
jgi:MATE family multidrug resistance protein